MKLCLAIILLIGLWAVFSPAHAMITENEAERIAADATGGIPNGQNDHRAEDGFPYWFVQVEVNQKLLVVKVGANSGKVYEIYEYGSKMPRGNGD